MSNLPQELAQERPSGPAAVTMGVFDGVHLGHRHLISHLHATAIREGATPVVITFRNHPLTVLRPDIKLAMLSTLEERLDLLHGAGVEHVAAITFDRDLSLLSAKDFILALKESLGMTHLVVGPDFALGHQRSGTIPVLQTLGETHGFPVEVADPFTLDGAPVNSTRIREALAAGEVSKAAACLDRSFALNGTVQRGEGRGAALGFPTANIGVVPGMAVPADGIYAGWLQIGSRRCQTAASIGTKPTFHDDGVREVEAHVLDFDGDLYGHPVRLELTQRIREQARFDNIDALVAQMHQDVAQVRRLLDSARLTQKP